jgi:hypothetical protein
LVLLGIPAIAVPLPSGGNVRILTGNAGVTTGAAPGLGANLVVDGLSDGSNTANGGEFFETVATTAFSTSTRGRTTATKY